MTDFAPWDAPTPAEDPKDFAELDALHAADDRLEGTPFPDDVVDAEVVDDEPEPITAELAVIAQLADDSAQAVALFRDPDAVRTLTRELGASLVERVQLLGADAKSRRVDGKVTQAVVAGEVQVLADAFDTLTAVSNAVKRGATEAQALLGDVVAEVVPEKADAGTGSIKVGDGHGADVKVTRTQGTKVEAQSDTIVDVLVSKLLTDAAGGGELTDAKAYAAGAREAIAALLELMSPPGWKTTALDALAKQLEDAQDFDNAIRLGHAYGRVAQGDPKTKVERVQRKAAAK